MPRPTFCLETVSVSKPSVHTGGWFELLPWKIQSSDHQKAPISKLYQVYEVRATPFLVLLHCHQFVVTINQTAGISVGVQLDRSAEMLEELSWTDQNIRPLMAWKKEEWRREMVSILRAWMICLNQTYMGTVLKVVCRALLRDGFVVCLCVA